MNSDQMDWQAYAQHYDLMCQLNPAYEQNIQLLKALLRDNPIRSTARVCDFGAGTGNYIKALADEFRSHQYICVDSSEEMLRIAQSKLSFLGDEKVKFQRKSLSECTFPPSYFDLIICANALYAMPDRENALSQIRDWLTDDGYAFFIDFGRPQRTLDWTFYIFRESLKAGKIASYLWALIRAREVIRQNRLTLRGQRSGRYWLHSTEEFRRFLENAGFYVNNLGTCYRGFCDYALVSRRKEGLRHKPE